MFDKVVVVLICDTALASKSHDLDHVVMVMCVSDIIHTVGPMGEDSKSLKSCYENCLRELTQLELRSIVSTHNPGNNLRCFLCFLNAVIHQLFVSWLQCNSMQTIFV